MIEAYIQKPAEIQAVEVKWENETSIREFMREEFDQHGFMVVYIHNQEDDRWVEQHRNYFSRMGVVGRYPGYIGSINEFAAIEGDWLVKTRPGSRIEVLKPQEFRKLYTKKSEYDES